MFWYHSSEKWLKFSVAITFRVLINNLCSKLIGHLLRILSAKQENWALLVISNIFQISWFQAVTFESTGIPQNFQEGDCLITEHIWVHNVNKISLTKEIPQLVIFRHSETIMHGKVTLLAATTENVAIVKFWLKKSVEVNCKLCSSYSKNFLMVLSGKKCIQFFWKRFRRLYFIHVCEAPGFHSKPGSLFLFCEKLLLQAWHWALSEFSFMSIRGQSKKKKNDQKLHLGSGLPFIYKYGPQVFNQVLKNSFPTWTAIIYRKKMNPDLSGSILLVQKLQNFIWTTIYISLQLLIFFEYRLHFFQ